MSVPVTFIVNRTTGVDALDVVVHGSVVAAVAGFISKRPDDDGRAVVVAHDHMACAVKIRLLPLGVVREHLVTITSDNKDTMAFQISFIQDPQTELIRQLI